MIDIAKLVKKHDELRAIRTPLEAVWRMLDRYFNPDDSSYIAAINENDGDGDEDQIYTSNQMFAAEDFAGGMSSAMTNPANDWVKVDIDNSGLKNMHEVKVWLEEAQRVFLASLKSSVSSFYREVFPFNMNYGVLGNAAFYSRDVPIDQRFIDRNLSVYDLVWDADQYGDVGDKYVKFSRTRAGAIEEFGEKNLPEDIVKCTDEKKKHDFIQALIKNPNIQKDEIGYKNKPILSVIIALKAKKKVVIQGFKTPIIHIARMNVKAGSSYGTGIGMRAMPTVRTGNVMQMDLLDAANQLLDPAYNVKDEDVALNLENWSGGINIGGIDRNGRATVQRVEGNAHGLQITLEMQKAIKEEISHFFKFASSSLANRTGLSPEEYYGNELKNLERLIPLLAGYHLEFLNPFLRSRFERLESLGQMPERPEALQDIDIGFEFDSPAAAAIRASKSRVIMTGLRTTASIAEFDPEVMDNVDVDGAHIEILHSDGFPAHLIRSPAKRDEIRQARHKQQAQQAGLEQVGAAADIAQKAGINVGAMIGVNDG